MQNIEGETVDLLSLLCSLNITLFAKSVSSSFSCDFRCCCHLLRGGYQEYTFQLYFCCCCCSSSCERRVQKRTEVVKWKVAKRGTEITNRLSFRVNRRLVYDVSSRSPMIIPLLNPLESHVCRSDSNGKLVVAAVSSCVILPSHLMSD